jgi:predicted secreted acid phosphatase
MAVSAPQAPPVNEPAPAAVSSVDEEPVELPYEIHWVRNSAEYVAALEQTYRFATEVLERRSAGKVAGMWAVAIDADETLISNSLQSKERALERNKGYFEHEWDAWVNRKEAPALPGAMAFLERVKELGVMLCRGETRDKQPRWTSVEDGTASPDLPPLEIIMWVGDNIHDFPGADQELRFSSSDEFSDFGDKFIILPNPLYGSWEENPQN